jgi:RimJ/RimL family protein N-acetyltransferase
MMLVELDRAGRAAALAGDLGGRTAAPGWPHEDTEPGLSFLDSGGTAFLVIDDDGRVAGECGTKTAPDRKGVVEIGYGLGSQSRGRGLGTAAVAALLEVLAARGVRAIDAEVHVINVASWRLLERLGFVTTGDEHAGYRRYHLAQLH